MMKGEPTRARVVVSWGGDSLAFQKQQLVQLLPFDLTVTDSPQDSSDKCFQLQCIETVNHLCFLDNGMAHMHVSALYVLQHWLVMLH